MTAINTFRDTLNSSDLQFSLQMQYSELALVIMLTYLGHTLRNKIIASFTNVVTREF